jgi:polyketide cyclase/dehydrase/lipid transport protein
MASHEFSIPTVWRLKAKAADVYTILNDPEEFVRWWPEVYLGVEVLRESDATGKGRIVKFVTKGKLPYHLSWQAELVGCRPPDRMSIRATGDLDGRGEWRLDQQGEWLEISYDWTVVVRQLWMVLLSPILKPVFVWNHRWAMQRGFEGLQREVARRSGLGIPVS